MWKVELPHVACPTTTTLVHYTDPRICARPARARIQLLGDWIEFEAMVERREAARIDAHDQSVEAVLTMCLLWVTRCEHLARCSLMPAAKNEVFFCGPE